MAGVTTLCCQLRVHLHRVSASTMESLKNGLQSHSGVPPFFSMRTLSLASSQNCCSVDFDAWCKRALNNTSSYIHDNVMGRLLCGSWY